MRIGNPLLTIGLLFSLAAQSLPAQSLTTRFDSDNEFAGNMFDITPRHDLVLTGMDINTTNPGTAVTIELWYANRSSRGIEQLPMSWTFLGSYSGISAGRDFPTSINLAGNGKTFLAGQTYGLFVNLSSYPLQKLRYSNGPAGGTTYTSAEMYLHTNVGNGTGGLGGFIFHDREWNGTLHYAVGVPSPQLGVFGMCPGLITIDVSTATPNAWVGIVFGQPGQTLLQGGACAGYWLDLANPTLMAIHRANGQGGVNFLMYAPVGACGISLQAVDLVSCAVSNQTSL